MANYTDLAVSALFGEGGSYYGASPLVLEDGHLIQTVAPVIEPITPAEAVAFLKRHPDDLDYYLNAINLCISAAREKVEHFSARAMIEATYEKTQSSVDGCVDLFLCNVTSIVKVETIADIDDDTRVLMPSTDYRLEHGRRIVPRSGGWPTHSGSASFIVTFKAGTAVAGSSPNDAQKAAARAAIRPVFRLAMLNLIGFWLENPEGQGTEAKYVIQAARFGALPPNVIQILSTGGGIPWGVK